MADDPSQLSRLDAGEDVAHGGVHVSEEGRWVTEDGRYWWDGQGWQPTQEYVEALQPATLPVDQRRRILEQQLTPLLRGGWRVVSQTDTTAQLVRPKNFSFWWATLWFLACGFGVLVYIFYYESKKDAALYLQVDDHGQLIRQ